MKKIFFLCFAVMTLSFGGVTWADDLLPDTNIKTTEQILDEYYSKAETDCATKIFSDALIANSDAVSEIDPENVVRAWAKNTMQQPDVLEKVLKCPEMQNVSDTETIYFSPFIYEFPNGRTITINYSTQPKIIKQRITLANKRSLPNGVVSPRLGDFEDSSKFMNTEPAWYGIMVVQHDSLSQFIGPEPDKNNTVSLKYISNHINQIYPHGYYCTSKSAIANNSDTINRVVHEVVDMEDDSNDYYVAGDVNLEWIMYAEIAADIIMTVATMGLGEVVLAGAKSLRATRTGIRLGRQMRRMHRLKTVKTYNRLAQTVATRTDDVYRLEQNLKIADEYAKHSKNLKRAKKAETQAKHEQRMKELFEEAKKIDPDITEDELANLVKNRNAYQREIAKSQKEIDKLIAKEAEQVPKKKSRLASIEQKYKQKNNTEKIKAVEQYKKQNEQLKKLLDAKPTPENLEKIKQLEKSIEDIGQGIKEYANLYQEIEDLGSLSKYIETAKQFENIVQYRNSLRALKGGRYLHTPTGKVSATQLRTLRRQQTGNVITKQLKNIGRFAKGLKAAETGAEDLTKAAKFARAGMSSKSAKFGDWLFDTTFKHGARLGKFERQMGTLYGLVAFLGEMWDRTSSTSKEFSNGIEFKPLCLLSADDIKGQENVVNYGMWLMWVGNSTDSVDDDAAYLQAMDFAAKFHYKLTEYQDKNGANCNVDIYVVRPIIKLDETNINDPHGEMFYLFMNDTPWTTAEQFGVQNPNIDIWNSEQQVLEAQDPSNKNAPQQTVNVEDNTEE